MNDDPNRPVTVDEVDAFRRKYFEHADYTYWQDRILWAWRRHTELKRPANKAKHLVDAYSIYMQVAEILLINMQSLTVKPEHFLVSLMIDNQGIREFGHKIVDDRDFLRRFTHNYIYKIRGTEPTTEELDFDVSILHECISNYLKDYNFLNSYKHGFRVHSTSGRNYMAIGRGGQSFKIFEGDSQITYYDFRKENGIRSLNEVSLYFNHERIFGKSLYLIIYLMNMRLSTLRILGNKKKITYPYFTVADRAGWDKTFGDGRWSSDLFSFVTEGQSINGK